MRKLSGSINIKVDGESPLFHMMTPDQALNELGSDLVMGLSSRDATKRKIAYGPNELEKPESESIWDKIKEQFEDLLVRILLLAAIVSFVISLTGITLNSS